MNIKQMAFDWELGAFKTICATPGEINQMIQNIEMAINEYGACSVYDAILDNLLIDNYGDVVPSKEALELGWDKSDIGNFSVSEIGINGFGTRYYLNYPNPHPFTIIHVVLETPNPMHLK